MDFCLQRLMGKIDPPQILYHGKAEVQKRVGEKEYYFSIVLKESGKVIGEVDGYPESVAPGGDGRARKKRIQLSYHFSLQ